MCLKERLKNIKVYPFILRIIVKLYFRYALYDLLIAMLPYLNKNKIRQVFDIATGHIQVNVNFI